MLAAAKAAGPAPEAPEGLQVKSITIGVARRCPHCGELPEDFRTSFTRIVEETYIVPAKSQHLSLGPDGKAFEYTPDKDCMSPAGRYPAVIVPRHLLGKVIRIDVQGSPAAEPGSRNGMPGEPASASTIRFSEHLPSADNAGDPKMQEGIDNYRCPTCGKRSETCTCEPGAPAAASGGENSVQREPGTPAQELSGAFKHSPPAETEGAPNNEACLKIHDEIIQRLKEEFPSGDFNMNDEDYEEIFNVVSTVLIGKGCSECEYDVYDGLTESHDCALPEGEKCPRGFDT